MSNTAVIHLPGNLCNVQLIINDQFFYPFNFMGNDELLDRDSLDLGEQICQVRIIVA